MLHGVPIWCPNLCRGLSGGILVVVGGSNRLRRPRPQRVHCGLPELSVGGTQVPSDGPGCHRPSSHTRKFRAPWEQLRCLRSPGEALTGPRERQGTGDLERRGAAEPTRYPARLTLELGNEGLLGQCLNPRVPSSHDL